MKLLPATDARKAFFKSVGITFKPSLSTLPQALQDSINVILEKHRGTIIAEANSTVTEYRKNLSDEQSKIPEKIAALKKSNKALLDKYEKNLEVNKLVKSVEKYTATLKEIKGLQEQRKTTEEERKLQEQSLESSIRFRREEIDDLITELSKVDQSALDGIVFGIQSDFDNDERENREAGINTRSTSEFVQNNKLDLSSIRTQPGVFLKSLHTGNQKIVKGYEIEEVAADILTFTEAILLTGKMEGDVIGGFTESTMSPGKRALFALRLLLLETEDKWPILIDQPEDDLDSRSIYHEIVPFLRTKKKERQIIMVSHNANLVIGSDSEQLVVTNRHGSDRPNDDGIQFNYLTGSLEFTHSSESKVSDTLKSQGTCEHACSILDGGKTAFEERKRKYQIR